MAQCCDIRRLLYSTVPDRGTLPRYNNLCNIVAELMSDEKTNDIQTTLNLLIIKYTLFEIHPIKVNGDICKM